MHEPGTKILGVLLTLGMLNNTGLFYVQKARLLKSTILNGHLGGKSVILKKIGNLESLHVYSAAIWSDAFKI